MWPALRMAASSSKFSDQLAARHRSHPATVQPPATATPSPSPPHPRPPAPAPMEPPTPQPTAPAARAPPQSAQASAQQQRAQQTNAATSPCPTPDAGPRSTSQQDMDLSSVSSGPAKLSNSPPGSYTSVPPRSIDPSAVPPILPPHLLQVILNNPDKVNSTILPQPNHVMLNHLYALSIKDGIMVLSATHRFRKKYVTTLLYKPIN